LFSLLKTSNVHSGLSITNHHPLLARKNLSFSLIGQLVSVLTRFIINAPRFTLQPPWPVRFGFPKSKVGTERSRDLEEDNNVNTTQRMADRNVKGSVYGFWCTAVRREFRTQVVGGGLRLSPIADPFKYLAKQETTGADKGYDSSFVNRNCQQ